jgi:hypothetical protein
MHYILGIWFVSHDERRPLSARADWLGVVWKTAPDSDWTLRYRISHHVVEGVWHPRQQDEKSVSTYTIAAAEPEEKLIAVMEEMATALARINEVPVNSILVQGDQERAFAWLAAQPWVHLRTEPLEEGP